MDLKELCQKALDCKYVLQNLSTEEKNNALKKVAEALVLNASEIVLANSVDMENGKNKGLSDGLMDRLLLTEDRVKAMADGMIQVADLEDPIGTVVEQFERPNGMTVINKRVPLGVVGVIYEARPNVTADVFALCFKTGNATVLKGGSDAINSNIAIVKVIRDALKAINMPEDALVLIEDTSRETTVQFMKMNGYIDVLIPRGSAGLIKRTVMESTVPVIETGSGNCHTYVDEFADFDMALNIIENAKTTRVGVCNACESLLIHENIKDEFLPLLAKRLSEKNVEVFADEMAKELMPESKNATEEDWGKEYLALMISVKCVKSVDEAISHINKYNTGHSECIVTNIESNAQKFLNGVDAACVYHNVSTRFTDGFEFGFGAEIGISTQKLHARGPMGLNALCSTKYHIIGNGQIRK